MTVQEFNSTLAKHKLQAPSDAHISILREEEGEMLVEVLGKRVWVQKRITEPYTPLVKRLTVAPVSKLPYLGLQPAKFKIMMWLTDISFQPFTGPQASEQLNMDTRSIRLHLKELAQSGMIRYESCNHAGYKVELVQ